MASVIFHVLLVGALVAAGGMSVEPPDADPPTEVVRPTLILTPEMAREATAPESRGEISTVDELLTELERTGKDLRSFSAQIRYTKFFPFEGDEQIREGSLDYLALPEMRPGEGARRKFAVHFDTLQFDGRIERGEDRSYIFDGQWLVEKLHKEKQFFKRQVVPPGERFDPLRLGEGPFPVPIGQSRAEILERFEAKMLASDAGTEALRKDVREWLLGGGVETYQLRLTPREGYADELDLSEIRLWYRRSDLLPRAAWTRSVNENESTIQLIAHRINAPIASERMDTSVPDRGWVVEVTEWRGSGAGSGEGP